MCGRYTLCDVDRAREHLKELRVTETSLDLLDRWRPRYNIAPSQQVLAVRASEDHGQLELVSLRWGLLPRWSKERTLKYNTINAKVERVDTAPAYRASFRDRRALILADGLYEWQRPAKTPYYIHLTDHAVFAFAGLWDRWADRVTGEVIESCSIIVGPPNELIRPIHDRLAVILPREHYDRWIDSQVTRAKDLKSLLQPYPSEAMAAYPVSRHVNRPANDDPQCVVPLE